MNHQSQFFFAFPACELWPVTPVVAVFGVQIFASPVRCPLKIDKLPENHPFPPKTGRKSFPFLLIIFWEHWGKRKGNPLIYDQLVGGSDFSVLGFLSPLQVKWNLITLPTTNSVAPENRPGPRRKAVFQPSIFKTLGRQKAPQSCLTRQYVCFHVKNARNKFTDPKRMCVIGSNPNGISIRSTLFLP